MKKIFVSLAIVLGMGTPVTSVLAINGTGLDKDGQTAIESDQANTSADAIFKLDDGAEVIDPTDSPKVILPDEEAKTTGQLRINHAPTIHFGEIVIEGVHSITNGQLTKGKKDSGEIRYVPNFLQVNDTRGDSFGWTVKANATSLIKVDSEGEAVAGVSPVVGAFISFKDMKVISASGMNNTDADLAPTVSVNDFSVAPGQENILGKKLDLVSGDELETPNQINMFEANQSGMQGINIWSVLYGTETDAVDAANMDTEDQIPTTDNIQLHVPAGAKKTVGNYKSTIIWEMVAAP
ncbi:WxL domain-containing protein [Carnobacterium divergens]|uniref:WxL domain-containing protein n=1 Tax=Carnobacterium divergens TaxID=2748 RepID=UPI0039C99B30